MKIRSPPELTKMLINCTYLNMMGSLIIIMVLYNTPLLINTYSIYIFNTPFLIHIYSTYTYNTPLLIHTPQTHNRLYTATEHYKSYFKRLRCTWKLTVNGIRTSQMGLCDPSSFTSCVECDEKRERRRRKDRKQREANKSKSNSDTNGYSPIKDQENNTKNSVNFSLGNDGDDLELTNM